jgi:uncharacterized protein YbjT (DUF2867 family)
MSRKIVIAGGSGLVGKQAAVMLARAGFAVHLVSRRPSHALAPGIQEHVAPTADWPAMVASIKPDVAISALGTTIRTAGSRDAFRAVDHDLVLAFAKASHEAGVQHFITISSVGAMPASSSFYLRTKAEMEQGLRNITTHKTHAFENTEVVGGGGLWQRKRAGPRQSEQKLEASEQKER